MAQAATLTEQARSYRAKLQVQLDASPLFQWLERNTGVPKFYIAAAAAVTVSGLVIANILASLLTNLVGFIYPAYASFKAIESADKEDDKHWLTYWVVFSFLVIVEFFAGWILSSIPFYFVVKLIFLVFLFNETTRGAESLYNVAVRPLLLQQQGIIDRSINRVAEEAQSLGERAKDAGSRVAAAVVADKIHGQ